MRLDHVGSPSLGVETDARSVPRRWDSPDGRQRVILGPSLILHLRQAAIEAFLAIPRRGMEIGGLLLGQVRQETNTTVFDIAAVEDVPCEHRFGPSYVLDDLDRSRLAEILARQQRAGGPPVIGFYRSYTGREARLDDHDQELVRAFFPQGHLACLLLQPLSMQRSAAGFCFWKNGELVSEPACVPFPFEADHMKAEVPVVFEAPPAKHEVLLAEMPVETRATARPVVAAEPDPEPPRLRPAYRRVERRYEEEDEEPTGSRRRRGILLPLVCCLLLGVAAAVAYQLWKVSREPRFAQVHLDARLSGREWLLNWDPAAAAVAHATRAVLNVTDGSDPQDFALTPEEIRGGRYGYTPAHSDVLFQLRLYDHEKPVAEDSLRVVGVSAPAKPKPAPTSPSIPSVLQEVDPVLSRAIRARIGQPMSVNVMVTIDRAGRVTRAWPKTRSRGLERTLSDAAVRAARQWIFEPAHSPTTVTIPFEFRPNR